MSPVWFLDGVPHETVIDARGVERLRIEPSPFYDLSNDCCVRAAAGGDEAMAQHAEQQQHPFEAEAEAENWGDAWAEDWDDA